MAFPKYPYTDFHRLNGDYLLDEVNKAKDAAEQAQAAAEEAVGLAEEAGAAALTAVRYEAQELTDAQKEQARENIDAADTSVYGSIARISSTSVRTVAQELSSAEKAQARENIDAASVSQLPDFSDVVRTSAQTLTADQKAQARTNIDAASVSQLPDVSDVVRTSAQTLTAGQKAQARTNIDAASVSQLPDVSDVVRTSAQTLTEAQKAQARTNIGAAVDSGDPGETVLRANIVEDSQGDYTLDGMAPSELAEALLQDYKPVFVFLFPYDQSFVMTLTDLRAREVASNNYSITATGMYNRTIYSVSIQIISDQATITIETEPVDYPVRQQVTGTSVTITPQAGVFYECSGILTEIQINTPGTDIHHRGWTVRFTTDSTCRTIFPSTIRGLENFSAEANTTYEINVLDNLAVVGSWAVSV